MATEKHVWQRPVAAAIAWSKDGPAGMGSDDTADLPALSATVEALPVGT